MNSDSTQRYEISTPWKKIGSENEMRFISDGKTIWKHLKINLPEKMESCHEYNIYFKTKFKTDLGHVRFYLDGDNDEEFQDLIHIVNTRTDDFYEVSVNIICKYEFRYLRVTSTDFIGENYFSISDIHVDKASGDAHERTSGIRKKYSYASPWKAVDQVNEIRFISDGKTKWQHLKIRLPEIVEGNKDYYISFKTKFKTDSGDINFFLQNADMEFNQLCCVENQHLDSNYEIALTFHSDGFYDSIRVTSSDFIGENYFEISDIEIRALTVGNDCGDGLTKEIIYMIGAYSECSCGVGSILDYFHDCGFDKISVFLGNDLLMKSLHAIAWESGLDIYLDIANRKYTCNFEWQKITSTNLDGILDSENIAYDKDIPIMICCDVDKKTKDKLYQLTDKIFYFNDIYNYAVSKNCILKPIYEYFRTNDIKAEIYNMYLTHVWEIETPSEYEKKILTHNYIKPYKEIYNNDITYKERVKNTNGPFWIGSGKKLKYIDVKNDDCVAFQGIRRTFYQPNKFRNCIWFVGTSVSSGIGSVLDEHTIESYLQEILNTKKPSQFIVNNVIMPTGGHYGNFVDRIKALPIKSGDIIIISNNYSSVFINSEYYTPQIRKLSHLIDTREYFQRPHDMGEIYLDLVHVGPLGCKRYAESIYTELFEETSKSDSKDEIVEQFYDEIKEYTRSFEKYKAIGKNGCIVMNCDPFTLGHRYLVEFAATQVDNLYIFVVEENRSMFSFEERIELVKKGVADISNVSVIPSGKFIISGLTFKAYFEKGKKQDVIIDASQDINIFGEYIAPALDISVRFAGSEPNCNITKQYNMTMKLILPKYGVDFIQIPRKKAMNDVISAKKVRELLELRDFGAISKLVPKTTLDYLEKMFK